MDPTPPAAAETATVSPGLTPAAWIDGHAVTPATNSEPAASQETPAGFGTSWRAGTLTASAWLARSSVHPITSAPALTEVTPGPTAVTTPAKSLPSPSGKCAGHLSCRKPALTAASPGLMAAATTCTTARPGAASGRATSTTSSSPVPPSRPNHTARIVSLAMEPVTSRPARSFPRRMPAAALPGRTSDRRQPRASPRHHCLNDRRTQLRRARLQRSPEPAPGRPGGRQAASGVRAVRFGHRGALGVAEPAQQFAALGVDDGQRVGQLAEHLALALLAAAAGLAVGWLAAPLLTNPGAGLVGTPGAPSLTLPTVELVTAVSLAVAVAATLVP